MNEEHHGDHGHVVPYGTFALVWLGLVVLTGTTVVAAGIDLGKTNVLVALAIATAKVTLVGFFFMHLKYEPRMLRIMVLISVFVLAVILSLTFLDTFYRP